MVCDGKLLFIYIRNHRLPEIKSANLFEASVISETVQVTSGKFGPFRNGRGVNVKLRGFVSYQIWVARFHTAVGVNSLVTAATHIWSGSKVAIFGLRFGGEIWVWVGFRQNPY